MALGNIFSGPYQPQYTYLSSKHLQLSTKFYIGAQAGQYSCNKKKNTVRIQVIGMECTQKVKKKIKTCYVARGKKKRLVYFL